MRRAKSGRELKSLMDIAGQVTEDKFVLIIKKLAFDGFANLIRLTPYDTGFAMSNWRVGINQTDEAPLYAGAAGTAYQSPQFGGVSIEFGDVVHLYNNTVYIGMLDAGYSQQEPAGMIMPTFEKISRIADQLAKALSKKKLNV